MWKKKARLWGASGRFSGSKVSETGKVRLCICQVSSTYYSFPLFSSSLRRQQLLRSDSRMGVRGPEQGNLYSKRRYEPGLCRSPHITLGRTEIRRRVAGVVNYPRSLLEETRGIESRASGPSCVRFFIDTLLSRRAPKLPSATCLRSITPRENMQKEEKSRY